MQIYAITNYTLTVTLAGDCIVTNIFEIIFHIVTIMVRSFEERRLQMNETITAVGPQRDIKLTSGIVIVRFFVKFKICAQCVSY